MRRLMFFVVGLCMVAFLNASIITYDVQSKYLLKILSYDKKMDRFGDPIKIGVTSEGMKKALNDSLFTVKGKSFIAEKMDKPEDIKKYKVVYIDENWKNEYEIITKLSEENSTLIFCNDNDFVESGGGSISFKVVNKKMKILVNYLNSKKQGSNFSTVFLRIVSLVGKK